MKISAFILATVALPLLARGQVASMAPPPPASGLSLQMSLQRLQGAFSSATQSWHSSHGAAADFGQDADSISRNLASAAPSLLQKYEADPQNLAAAFRLYRDLSAVDAVAQHAADTISRHGPRSSAASLASAVAQFDAQVNSFANSIEASAQTQQQELHSLRASVAAHAPPPASHTVVIDANGPRRRSAHHRRRKHVVHKAAKPSGAARSNSSSSGGGASSTPPSQNPPRA
jgi:hypothetical protein